MRDGRPAVELIKRGSPVIMWTKIHVERRFSINDVLQVAHIGLIKIKYQSL